MQKALPFSPKILLSVAAFHLVFLCLLNITSHREAKIKHPKKIAVRTVILPHVEKSVSVISHKGIQETPAAHPQATPLESPPLSKPQESPKPSAPKTSVQEKNQPAIKKSAHPPPQKKETTKTSMQAAATKTDTKTTTTSKSQLLSLMQESLSKLDATSDHVQKSGSGKASLSKGGNIISKLGSENFSGWTVEASYQEELVAYLKHLIQLPEKGDVKLQLTLTQEGKVTKVVIVSSLSEKNKTYLEKTLTTLTFPPFDQQFKGEKEHTFPITLKGK